MQHLKRPAGYNEENFLKGSFRKHLNLRGLIPDGSLRLCRSSRANLNLGFALYSRKEADPWLSIERLQKKGNCMHWHFHTTLLDGKAIQVDWAQIAFQVKENVGCFLVQFGAIIVAF